MTADILALTDDPEEKKGRSWPVIVAVTVCIGLVVGGAAWFAHSWLARGPQPAEVLPASTLAYVSLDLDPAGDQKVAAMDALGKFPGLGGSGDDLELDDVRRELVEGLSGETCDELKYAEVKGWMGDRVALALVDQEQPEPVLVVQVDGDGASDGLKAVATCFGDDGGYARTGDWAVVARTTSIAERVIEDGEKNPLEDDGEFTEWTEAAGEPGVVTLYVAPEAGDALLEYAEENPEIGYLLMSMPPSVDPAAVVGPMTVGMLLFMPFGDSGSGEFSSEEEPMPRYEAPPLEPGDLVYPGMPGYAFPAEPTDDALDAMTDEERETYFEEQYQPRIVGEDGEVREMTPEEKATEDRRQAGIERQIEQEMAEDELLVDEEFDEEFDEDWAPEIPDEVRKSIADFSGLGGVIRFHDGALELELVSDRVAGSTADLSGGAGGAGQLGELPAGATAAYGMSTIDDFGSRFVQLLEQQMNFMSGAEVLEEFEKGTGLDLPGDLDALGGGSIAVVVGAAGSFESTPADVEVAVRLEGDAAGIEASLAKLEAKVPGLKSRRDGDAVLVGLNAAFLDEVADGGGLDDSDRYRKVVPDGGDANMVFFLDFDTQDWLVEAAAEEDKGDVRPLDSLGISRTTEDGVDHTLVRLTLD